MARWQSALGTFLILSPLAASASVLRESQARPSGLPAVFERLRPNKIVAEDKKEELPQSLMSRPEEPKDILACIESLCGPAIANWGAYDLLDARKNPSATFENWWNGRVRPAMKELMEERQQVTVTQNSRFLQLAKRGYVPRNLGPLRIPVALLLSVNSLSAIVEDFNQSQKNLQEKKKFDRETLLANLDRVPADQREAVLEIYSVFYETSLEKTLLSYLTPAERLVVRLIKKYPAMDPARSLFLDAKENLGKLSSFENIFRLSGASLTSLNNHVIAQRALKGDLSTQSQVNDYLEMTQSVELMEQIFKGSLFKKLSRVIVNPAARIQELKKDSRWERLLQKDALAEPRITAWDLEKFDKTCKPSVNLALSSTASPLKQRQFRILIDELKEKSRRVAIRIAPDQRDEVNQVIDNLSVIMPESASEIQRTIELEIEKVGLSHLADQEMLKQGLLDKIVFLKKIYSLEDGTENQQPLQRVCAEAGETTTFSDYALPMLKRVSISWSSINQPEVGLGVLAHEIGHVVSYALANAGTKSPGFATTRACTVNRNPFKMNVSSVEEVQQNLRTPQEFESAEEDWADYFSNLVMNEVRRDRSGRAAQAGVKNMACALVVDSGALYSAKNTFRPHKNDNHSSGLLRLLMGAADSGQMTDACRPFMDYAAANNRSLTCP
ncbi:MAG: hypothetical protein KF802_15615 [Bdellovibrionaceae bacterium]|nr:hypothetical protein [Pseudobdellovibrionaceae bacterium]MBX3033515.1 hypothetical protein [Pseudobdellovibrionaceae bacterium]